MEQAGKCVDEGWQAQRLLEPANGSWQQKADSRASSSPAHMRVLDCRA